MELDIYRKVTNPLWISALITMIPFAVAMLFALWGSNEAMDMLKRIDQKLGGSDNSDSSDKPTVLGKLDDIIPILERMEQSMNEIRDLLRARNGEGGMP